MTFTQLQMNLFRNLGVGKILLSIKNQFRMPLLTYTQIYVHCRLVLLIRTGSLPIYSV